MRSSGRARWVTTVGGCLCHVCGLEGRIVATPNRWARVRGWLFDGQAPRSTLQCPNDHAWLQGSSAALWVKAGGRRSWWSWPVRMLGVVRAHRTAEPVPVFWLGATVVGIAMGVVLQLIFGWSWWLVVVVCLLLVWLVFLATALRRLGRDGLWVDLVRTVSPARAEGLESAQLMRMVQSAPGPVHGLVRWTGQRSVGGHGHSSSSGLTHLELIYGDPPDGPHLRVDTMWRRQQRSDVELDRLRQELTRELWHRQAVPPEGVAPEDFQQWAMKAPQRNQRTPTGRSEHLEDHRHHGACPTPRPPTCR